MYLCSGFRLHIFSNRNMNFTVLIDNRRKNEALWSEHGFSLLFETDGQLILLDTGASGRFADNWEMLAENRNASGGNLSSGRMKKASRGVCLRGTRPADTGWPDPISRTQRSYGRAPHVFRMQFFRSGLYIRPSKRRTLLFMPHENRVRHRHCSGHRSGNRSGNSLERSGLSACFPGIPVHRSISGRIGRIPEPHYLYPGKPPPHAESIAHRHPGGAASYTSPLASSGRKCHDD